MAAAGGRKWWRHQTHPAPRRVHSRKSAGAEGGVDAPRRQVRRWRAPGIGPPVRVVWDAPLPGATAAKSGGIVPYVPPVAGPKVRPIIVSLSEDLIDLGGVRQLASARAGRRRLSHDTCWRSLAAAYTPRLMRRSQTAASASGCSCSSANGSDEAGGSAVSKLPSGLSRAKANLVIS
jgi:hypothetical protein